MGMGELERLVDEAERDGVIRRSLRRCRSRAELVLAARRLGYGIHRIDLRCAWLLHQREAAVAAGEHRRGFAA
ncbi:MAG: nitrogen fixation protein [Cyanobium sp.]